MFIGTPGSERDVLSVNKPSHVIYCSKKSREKKIWNCLTGGVFQSHFNVEYLRKYADVHKYSHRNTTPRLYLSVFYEHNKYEGELSYPNVTSVFSNKIIQTRVWEKSMFYNAIEKDLVPFTRIQSQYYSRSGINIIPNDQMSGCFSISIVSRTVSKHLTQ